MQHTLRRFLIALSIVGFAGMVRAADGSFIPDYPAAVEQPEPWYYELQGEVPADEVRNGISWTYWGQHVFSDPDYLSPLDETESHTRRELQMAAIRVDNLGREWHVAAIDEDAMQLAADAYAESVRQDFGTEYEGWNVAEQLDSTREAATYEGPFIPTSWDSWDCDTGADDMWVWDDESRVEMTVQDSSSNAIQSTVILLQEGFGFVCSGAFVDADGKVLTAAHCVTDPANGSELDPTDFEVCTRGNHYTDNTCYTVDEIVADPSYPGANWNLGFANDFAVMSVSSLRGDTIHHLGLSTHTTAQLEASSKASNAYPEWTEGGSGNCVRNQPGIPNIEQKFFRESAGDVLNATSTVLRTRLDTSAGASGGSITHTSGGTQFHAAVIDGYYPAITPWSGGARTSANTSFIEANP